VLCIIEAMKVFNELKAEFSGTVVKVLVENGKPVKANQDLFWIQRG
jgi:biotin carboxyl carrier protein